MTTRRWARGPIGPDADYLYPDLSCRKVLAVVHTVTAGTRLLDVVPLLESDFRIQVVFTRCPSPFGNGVDEFLASVGGLVVPWEQATMTRFDLAIAADFGHLEEVRAPLVVLCHGADNNKYGPQRPGPLRVKRFVNGYGPQWLVWDGSVVPAAIILAHKRQEAVLGEGCPEALPAAVVGGDPCLDRILVSRPNREVYRQALGVRDRKLVVVSSTWGPNGLLGANRDLLERLVAELPSGRFQVVIVLHPLIWYWHGPWQVKAWLARARRAGVGLVPPEEGWRAALVAADWVIGDHGSVTLYGAAIGVPVTLAACPDDVVHPDSTAALLTSYAPRLVDDEPLSAQYETVVATGQAKRAGKVVEWLTSLPGRSAVALRELLYRLMCLPVPARPPVVDPVPSPILLSDVAQALDRPSAY